MSAITTKFVTDHELTNEMSLEELSRYAPEILKETAQRIMRDSLGEKEVKLIAKALAETSSNPVACTSSLSRLRKELRKLNAPKAIIEATKIPGITTLSNKIQKEKSLLCED